MGIVRYTLERALETFQLALTEQMGKKRREGFLEACVGTCPCGQLAGCSIPPEGVFTPRMEVKICSLSSALGGDNDLNVLGKKVQNHPCSASCLFSPLECQRKQVLQSNMCKVETHRSKRSGLWREALPRSSLGEHASTKFIQRSNQ